MVLTDAVEVILSGTTLAPIHLPGTLYELKTEIQ